MSKKKTAMYQRTIDFEAPTVKEADKVAEDTSLPPPEKKAPLLVRPDRQIVYEDAANHFTWPDPSTLHDHDTITVDRIHSDIDGPSHRFIIKRGDTVEAFFSSDKIEPGEVVGISHAKNEVSVRFPGCSEGIWFHKGCIYPAPVEDELPLSSGVPLSQLIDEVNEQHGSTLTEADRIPTAITPFTFDDFTAFHKEFRSGRLPYSTFRERFEEILGSQEALHAELKTRFNAKKLQNLAAYMGSWSSKRSTKDENASHVVSKMLSTFLLDGTVSYSPMSGETYIDAVTKKVRAVTEDDYAAELRKREEKSAEQTKALTNPETFFEFRTFLQSKSESDLTDEQLSRYDALHADSTRERRKSETKTNVTKFESDELASYKFEIREGFHDKRQCPLWIVQLETRVERATFNELNIKAKMLGGWYSSFKKSDAGFQFTDKERADKFVSLLSGDADRTDVLERRKEFKEKTAAEALHELADDMAARAEETITRSENSLQNTERRAGIQAGVRGNAYKDLALSRTMHSVAEALSCGQAEYLDGVRHRTHFETLGTILSLAKWARIRSIRQKDSESQVAHSVRLDSEQERPISEADIRFAEYPFPHVYKRHLEQAILACRNANGAKLASERMAKRLRREKDDYVTFTHAGDIEEFDEYLGRAKAAGHDTQQMEWGLDKYRRLQRANICDIHELRAALREYLPHVAEVRGDSPLKVAERELIGKDLPGFFPTPPSVIRQMLELADIHSHHRVLEPSCGKGDIVDAIKGEYPDVAISAIERNRTLEDVLSAKGHEVEYADFLEHKGFYDRVVMNPPFENSQDIDHVQHAFEQLAPSGRLVSVMSEGPFFRQDKKASAFREWLRDVGGSEYPLPDDAFRGPEAFRQTGVRTRLVVIDRT